jgi:hypothetical protein
MIDKKRPYNGTNTDAVNCSKIDPILWKYKISNNTNDEGRSAKLNRSLFKLNPMDFIFMGKVE